MSVDPRTHDLRAFGVVTPNDAGTAAQNLAEDRARALWQGDAAARALGVRVDEVGPGRAVLVMTVRADMASTCDGTAVAALADRCWAYACCTEGDAAVGGEGHIDHVAPAQPGEVLRAEGLLRVRTDDGAIHDVTIAGADGRTIALFRGRSRRAASAEHAT